MIIPFLVELIKKIVMTNFTLFLLHFKVRFKVYSTIAYLVIININKKCMYTVYIWLGRKVL